MCVYVRQLVHDSVLGPKTLMTPANSDITQRNQREERYKIHIMLIRLKAAQITTAHHTVIG